jgi:Trk K+ transport system NAD-binding subunit
LTEALLSSKFEFTHKQPAIPTENHVVIVGCGRVGEKVAKLLREYKQTVLAISLNPQIDQSKWQGLPLIIGNVQESLKKAHLDKAKTVVVVTDDDIVNLEVALITQLINPRTNLVIRSNGDDLTANLTQLLPQASVIGVYQVSAEAFAGAAFGENILHILHFAHQTILVTEYQISEEDTLNGLLLTEIAYGYGVMPILYQAHDTYSPTLLPGDDLQANIGDRLIVLATIAGLRRIEEGNRERPTWELVIQSAYSNDALFEGANTITRISGCPLAVARETVNNLPQTLPIKLYRHQALRLIRALGKNRIKSELKQ